MSAFDANPFADPVDVNPFQDPSVTQLTNANQGSLDEFNPFSENSRQTNTGQPIPTTQPAGASQPAVLQTSVEPTPQLLLRQASKYLTPKFISANSEGSERQKLLEDSSSQIRRQVKRERPKSVASSAQAGLLKQQEELEKKAAELDRKERELQNSAAGFDPKQNNWPPLPRFCPVKPCFYQDFSADIPADYQHVCKMMYYLWMFYSVTLVLNLLACLALFTVEPSTTGSDFGLSILWLVLFTPCAFLCWYRPVYKAFRSDSSFSFFFFFFIFLCQGIALVVQAVGIPNWGSSGWILALSMTSNLAVKIIMMVVAVFFTTCAILSIFLLKRVHSLYRRTGASFQRAQEEFSQGILSNRSFQTAASGAASTAAQNAFRGN
ncbi:secretory carrier-associated membrane protein 2 isoform X2 [Crotalus tigris]|uniref:secretory carrier-associated membrane protein 2 isoform X2 n=1 Tax=Crotalus tigris TaxID=88082 RepID=UPI00192F394F|nr:secretory carrier-associated membrane protein 2 isoform X2 [Crotalus tigris]